MKNKYEVLGETTVIHLDRHSHKTLCTFIDTDDLELLKNHGSKWYANYHKRSQTYYVMSNIRKPDGKSTLIGLHRFLMGPPKGKVVDHIDRNTLNNKRSNLRSITQAQNNQNRRLQSNNTSGARGVYWCNHREVWRAYVKHQGKNHYFGNHKGVEEAEKAAKEGRRLLLPYSKQNTST